MTPVNMSGEDVHAAAGLSGAEVPTAPAADELDNWAQENYSLSASAAASVGFPVGSVTATVQRDRSVGSCESAVPEQDRRG
jgi:hypothetical protein